MKNKIEMKEIFANEMIVGNHYFDCSNKETALEFKLIEKGDIYLMFEPISPISECIKDYIQNENEKYFRFLINKLPWYQH